jgi:cell division protein FtsN
MKEFGKIKEHYEFSFDSRKLGLVLFGAFLFAVLVFVLGVSVGRRWETKKREAAPAQAAVAPVSPPKPDNVAPAVPPVTPPVAPPATPPVVPPAAPPVAAPAPAPAVTPTQPAKTITVTPRPDPAGKKAPDNLTFPKVLTSNTRKTTPLTPENKKAREGAGTTGVYTVQVGAYNEKKEAQTRVDRLRRKGYDARVHAVKEKSGKTLYKVRVGSFDTRGDAASTAKKLDAAERLTPYITLDK